MKKKLLSILCLTLAILALVSCGSASYSDTSSSKLNGYMTAPQAPGGMPAESYDYNSASYDMAVSESEIYYEPDYAYDMPDAGRGVSATAISAGMSVSLAEKIIYSANASIETIHFEESLKELSNMITQFNAFVENSYESGSDYASKYYGYNSYRNASYVIRVPRENFSALTGALSALGHVTSLSTDATNVTEQYTDVESRLTVYRTEESRLLSMLEKCDNVTDMITIESTLSNTRYNIESLTSQLKNLDNRVNYSSVSIFINEVEELTPVVQIRRTYGQQLSDGLKDTLVGVGNFFKNLLKFIIVSSPVLVIIMVIAVVILVLYRRYSKREKKRLEAAKAAKVDADENN